LSGGGYLLVAARKTAQGTRLHRWLSKDLAGWTDEAALAISAPGAIHTAPSLCPLKDGRVLLLWVAREGESGALLAAATADGRDWPAPETLREFAPSAAAEQAPAVVETAAGDCLVLHTDQWMRGRPGAWGDWEPLAIEQFTGVPEKPDLLRAASGRLLLAFHAQAPSAESAPAGPATIVFVAPSETGETWAAPVEVGRGANPHVYESDGRLWLIHSGARSLEAWYSTDGRRWFGPSPMPRPFDASDQSDIADLGDGRFGSVSWHGERGGSDLVCLHVGERFPRALAHLETAHRWEDFPEASNAFSLRDGERYIWSVSPYTGFGRFDKRTGAFERSFSLWRRGGPPDLDRHTIGALALDGANVWIGANGAGLFCLKQDDCAAVYRAEPGRDIRLDIITALAVDPNFVWVGTPVGLEVLGRKDRYWLDFDHVAALKGLPIVALTPAREWLWIGTRDGRVLRFNMADEVDSPVAWPDGATPGKIIALFVDGGQIRVVAENGVWQCAASGGTARRLFDGAVQDAALDGDSVWLAGGNRLRRIRRGTGVCEEILLNSDAYRLPTSNSVWSVAVDDQHVYASVYGGITRAPKTKVEALPGF